MLDTRVDNEIQKPLIKAEYGGSNTKWLRQIGLNWVLRISTPSSLTYSPVSQIYYL